jgi:hypothetical protein
VIDHNFQIGAPADVLVRHSWLSVRFDDLLNRFCRRLNNLVRSVQPDSIFQSVNGHQSIGFYHFLLQRVRLKPSCFIDEFRIKCLALSKLPAQEISSVLRSLVGVGGNE